MILDLLLEPFAYAYMVKAMWVAALVGGTCALLSAYLMLKGWSLMGDALSHAIVPGVALAWTLGAPLALGAFIAGGLAAGSLLLLGRVTQLKSDTLLGLIFVGFFGLGLFILSISPVPVDLNSLIEGNLLAIRNADALQLVLIATLVFLVVALKWKDLLLIFFDETHARTLGLKPMRLRLVFFALLAAACLAALQTVGAFLVVALLITPGATAYLLSDRFGYVLLLSLFLGLSTSLSGAYLAFYLDGAMGPLIVCLQSLLFALAFLFAPQHGWLAQRRAAHRLKKQT